MSEFQVKKKTEVCNSQTSLGGEQHALPRISIGQCFVMYLCLLCCGSGRRIFGKAERISGQNGEGDH